MIWLTSEEGNRPSWEEAFAAACWARAEARRKKKSSRKPRPLSRYQQLRDLAGTYNEDVAEPARNDLRREYPR